MGQIVTSADISYLDFSVLLDISNAVPTAKITNLSTVVNAANLQWAFTFTSPSGTTIHTGSLSFPDINATPFVIFQFAEQIPLYFSQVEFSNQNKYTVTVTVKDSSGAIFTLTKAQSICKPNGNLKKGNFGTANVMIESQCAKSRLYITDATNVIYKSIVGTKVSSQVQLTYPTDRYGNTPIVAPVTSIPCLLPIYSEGDGHELYVAYVYDYDLGDGFIVRVRYSFVKTFPVFCNITLLPLLSEIDKIANALAMDCSDSLDTKENQRLLTVANSKLLRAQMGIISPLSDYNVPDIIEEVKDLLSLQDCNCYVNSGESGADSFLLVADANFTTNKVCGDMLLSWDKDVLGNITLNYQNTSYTFVNASNSESAAFTYLPTVSGCNKQVALKVDMSVLSSEVLSEIQTNPTLLNILSGITQNAKIACSSLDGGLKFNFANCNYNVVIDTLVPGATFVSFLIGGTTFTAPSGTLLIDAVGIQTYLNTLAKGIFVANYNSITNKTTISSNNNSNTISTVTIVLGVIQKTISFTNDCGFICNILQKIFTYLNSESLVNISVGGIINICSINPSSGALVTNTYPPETLASSIVSAMAVSMCSTFDYFRTRTLSCDNLKALFANYLPAVGNPNGADIFYMVVNGVCQEMPVKNVALAVFGLAASDTDVKSAFCNISPCTTVNNCSQVTGLAGTTTDTTQSYSWTGVTGAIGYKYSTDGTNYSTVTATSVVLTGLTAGTTYTFRVFPVYTSGDGNACQVTQSFTTTNAGSTCAAPANLVISGVTGTSFNAAWNVLAGATGYQYRLNGGSWVNIGTATTTTVTGLTNGTYNFDVRAIIGGSPCTQISTGTATIAAPSLVQISGTGTGIGGTETQVFQVGANIAAGNTFRLETYSHPTLIVAVSGDTPSSIAIKLRDAINATTESQWNSSGSAPASGTNGFKPTASASGSQITIVLDAVHSFSSSAY